MNRRRKGIRIEKKIQKILEKHGWTTHRATWKPLYIKGKLILVGADIFGCDLIAIKKGYKPKFISATCHTDIKTRINRIISYPFDTRFVDIEVWQYKQEKRTFKIYRIRLDEECLIEKIDFENYF